MGKFYTSVPNAHLAVAIDDISLIDGLMRAVIKDANLSGVLQDGLTDDEYDSITKQLRLVYAFSLRTVYSESYQYSTKDIGHHYSGRDERKSHLLGRSHQLEPKFIAIAVAIFKDLLKSKPTDKQKTKLFNLLYIWTRALELQQLHLPLEAQVLLGKVVDDMTKEGPDFKAGKLIKGLGIIQTPSDQFAARLLLSYDRNILISAKDELDGFSYLFRLRQRQADVLSGESPYYLGKKILSDIENKNAFLFEITRLYILWQFGQRQYYLKQNASLYKVLRRKQGIDN